MLYDNKRIMILRDLPIMTKKLPAHPLIYWLSKLFRPLDPWVEIKVPVNKNTVPVYLYKNMVFANPEQSRILTKMENIS